MEKGVNFFQLVGVANDKGWSQVRVVGEVMEEERGILGSLAVVLCLRSGENLSERGGDLIEEIAKDFIEGGEVTRVEWIKGELNKLKEKLSEGDGLLLMIVGGEGKKIFAGGIGEGMSLRMKRGEKVGVLWRGGGVINGPMEQGDVLVGGSEEMERLWSFKGESYEEVEEVQGKIVMDENSERLAGVVVEVGRKNAYGEGERDKGVIEARAEKEEVESEEIEEKKEEIEEKEEDSTTNEEEVVEEESEKKVEASEETEEEVKDKDEGEEMVADTGVIDEEIGGERRSFLNKGVNISLPKMEKRKWGLVGGVVFVVLLLISVGVGVWQKGVRAAEKEYLSVAEPISASLNEAEEVYGVSAMRSRKLVMEAREKISEQGERFEKSKQKSKWDELKKRTEELWGRVSGEKMVEGKKWLDVSVIREGTKAERLGTLGEAMVGVLDKGAGVAIKVDFKDKSGTVVGGGESLVESLDIGGDEKKALVMTKNGVVQIDIANQTSKKVIEPEGVWGGVVRYFAGNVYIADSEEVWKYPAVDEGFGKRRRYFGVGVVPVMNDVVDMQIDGRIWLLYKNGGIKKFERGNPVDFKSEELVEEWGEASRLSVEQEGKRLFVLDVKRGQVVALDKESGEYLGTYKWDGFKEVTGMVVDEAGNRLIVGKGGELYEIGL